MTGVGPEWEDEINYQFDIRDKARHGLPLPEFFDRYGTELTDDEDSDREGGADLEFRLTSEEECSNSEDGIQEMETVTTQEARIVPNDKTTRPFKQLRISAEEDTTVSSTLNTAASGKTLTALPRDIIYEISSCLSPTSLMSLARASKALWGILMIRHAVPVWRSALQHDNAPECPQDFSEPRWVHFLYGIACEICNQKGLHYYDAYIRKRACVSCLQKNLISSDAFAATFPDYDSGLADLVLYTEYKSKRYFWKDDVHSAASELQAMNNNKKVTENSDDYVVEDWKAAKKAFVDGVVKDGQLCMVWLGLCSRWRRLRMLDRCTERAEEIQEKLEALGYTDIEEVDLWEIPNVFAGRKLTEKEWLRFRPTVEAELRRRRDERLAAERESLFFKRKMDLHSIYLNHCETLTPALWVTLPHPSEISQFLASIYNGNRDLKEFDKSTVTAEIMTYISDNKERRRKIASSLLPAISQADSNCSIGSSSLQDCLQLATSVFLCQSKVCSESRRNVTCRHALIGWADLESHPYCYKESFPWPWSRLKSPDMTVVQPEIVYSERGSVAAAALVRLVNLDPVEATPQQLDTFGCRFVCLSCPKVQCLGSKDGRPAFPWRECISHFTDPDVIESHEFPNWMLVPAEASAEIRQKEDDKRSKNQSYWSCNRCPEHLEAPLVHNKVIGHLKSSWHKIYNPVEGVDYVYLMPSIRPRKVPRGYPFKGSGSGAVASSSPGNSATSSSHRYRCLMCTSKSRLFVKDGVISHIRDKHHVSAPLEDVNFRSSE